MPKLIKFFKKGFFMDKKEKIAQIEHFKDFFVRSFFISFVMLLASTLICVLYYDCQSQLVLKFFDIESDDYGKILVSLLGLWKILIIQFTLIPAFALWLMGKSAKKEV